jgi:hypothetical protein
MLYLFRADEPLDAVAGERDARGRHQVRNEVHNFLPKPGTSTYHLFSIWTHFGAPVILRIGNSTVWSTPKPCVA